MSGRGGGDDGESLYNKTRRLRNGFGAFLAGISVSGRYKRVTP
jgi:hypothetical protein